MGSPGDSVTSGGTKHLIAKLVGGAFATIVAPVLVTFLVKYFEKSDPPLPPPAVAVPVAAAPLTVVAGSTAPQSSTPNGALGVRSPSPIVTPGIRDGAGPSIDILARIEPAVHARNGGWKKDRGVLISPSDIASASLELPVEAAPAYRLEMLVERKSGKLGFNIFFPIDGRIARLTFESHQGRLSGLEGIDGKSIGDFGYPHVYGSKVFPSGRPTMIVVDVTPTSVRTVCDDKTIVDWHGNARSFSLSKLDEAFKPIPGRLLLGSNRSEFQISRLTYTPLDAANRTSSATTTTSPAGSSTNPPKP